MQVPRPAKRVASFLLVRGKNVVSSRGIHEEKVHVEVKYG
jgi:hypothetical protein